MGPSMKSTGPFFYGIQYNAAAMIDRARLAELLAQEDDLFTHRHPRSRALFQQAQAHLLGGVPMNWMVRWAGPFPLFVRSGQGAHFEDVDGLRYLDLC